MSPTGDAADPMDEITLDPRAAEILGHFRDNEDTLRLLAALAAIEREANGEEADVSALSMGIPSVGTRRNSKVAVVSILSEKVPPDVREICNDPELSIDIKLDRVLEALRVNGGETVSDADADALPDAKLQRDGGSELPIPPPDA